MNEALEYYKDYDQAKLQEFVKKVKSSKGGRISGFPYEIFGSLGDEILIPGTRCRIKQLDFPIVRKKFLYEQLRRRGAIILVSVYSVPRTHDIIGHYEDYTESGYEVWVTEVHKHDTRWGEDYNEYNLFYEKPPTDKDWGILGFSFPDFHDAMDKLEELHKIWQEEKEGSYHWALCLNGCSDIT